MVFSSITFLFFFLPAVLLLYYFCKQWRNGILLAASLFFYFWGEGAYLLVMLFSIVINFVCGRLMVSEGRLRENARLILTIAIICNFSMLGLFKYASFFTENLNLFLTSIHFPAVEIKPFHLPLGISFFTFQAVSYLIDIYREEAKPQKNIINLALYISLFPQLIAGPIVRYKDIASAIITRKFCSENVADGIRLFVYGLSKKVLLANPLALTADTIFALPVTDLNGAVAWLGAICFTLQIYFDFSGYTDMAIGLGRMFGFHFPINFNYPYISKSIREFWRRWHISLSLWFRDYLYIPLGGSRNGTWRTGRNLFIVFILCGLWHGASWTFICWGLYHGLFLVLERTFIGNVLTKLWSPFRHCITLLIVIIGWVVFKSETMTNSLYYLSAMFQLENFYDKGLVNFYLDKKLITELTAAVILAAPVIPFLKNQYLHWQKHIPNKITPYYVGVFEFFRLSTLTALAYFAVISLAADAYNPFIYFRF